MALALGITIYLNWLQKYAFLLVLHYHVGVESLRNQFTLIHRGNFCFWQSINCNVKIESDAGGRNDNQAEKARQIHTYCWFTPSDCISIFSSVLPATVPKALLFLAVFSPCPSSLLYFVNQLSLNHSSVSLHPSSYETIGL